MPKMVNFKLTATGQFWMPDEAAGGGDPEYGIVNLGTGSIRNSTGQEGWRFTVGANDLSVSALRAYVRNENLSTMTLRLWRVTGESLVASANITPVADAWVEAPITPVAISATEDYIITIGEPTGTDTTWGAYLIASPASSVFNSEITFVANAYATPNGDVYPGSSIGDYLTGFADIKFTVG